MEMEAEEEEDAFASIIEYCKPIASSEAEFANMPLARESEIFPDSNNTQFSSLPSQPTGIVVITLPDSDEEDAELPEHNYNPNELCAEQLGIADATKVRVSQIGLENEQEIQRVTVERGEEFDGDVISLGDTEESESEGDEREVIVLDSEEDSGDEKIRASSNLDAELGGLLSNSESYELGENVVAIRGEMLEENSKLSGISAGKRVRLSNRGFEKDAKKRKDSHRNGRVRSSREENDGEGEGRTGTSVGCSGSKGLDGKETEVVESSEKKRGLMDMLDELEAVFGCMDGGCAGEEVVDIVEIAKSKGMEFPRPRWWPDGDGKGYPYS